MKKMICEICGSQKIRKINDFFACQECGTEYSLEEAKKLLNDVEIEIKKDEEVVPSKQVNNEAKETTELKKGLLCWLEFVSIVNNSFNADFHIDLTNPSFYKTYDLSDYSIKDSYYYIDQNHRKCFLTDTSRDRFVCAVVPYFEKKIGEFYDNFPDSKLVLMFNSLPFIEDLNVEINNYTFDKNGTKVAITCDDFKVNDQYSDNAKYLTWKSSLPCREYLDFKTLKYIDIEKNNRLLNGLEPLIILKIGFIKQNQYM